MVSYRDAAATCINLSAAVLAVAVAAAVKRLAFACGEITGGGDGMYGTINSDSGDSNYSGRLRRNARQM